MNLFYLWSFWLLCTIKWIIVVLFFKKQLFVDQEWLTIHIITVLTYRHYRSKTRNSNHTTCNNRYDCQVRQSCRRRRRRRTSWITTSINLKFRHLDKSNRSTRRDTCNHKTIRVKKVAPEFIFNDVLSPCPASMKKLKSSPIKFNPVIIATACICCVFGFASIQYPIGRILRWQ